MVYDGFFHPSQSSLPFERRNLIKIKDCSSCTMQIAITHLNVSHAGQKFFSNHN